MYVVYFLDLLLIYLKGTYRARIEIYNAPSPINPHPRPNNIFRSCQKLSLFGGCCCLEGTQSKQREFWLVLIICRCSEVALYASSVKNSELKSRHVLSYCFRKFMGGGGGSFVIATSIGQCQLQHSTRTQTGTPQPTSKFC